MRSSFLSIFLCIFFGINCTDSDPRPKGPLDGQDGASGPVQGEDGEDGQDAPN